MAEKRMFAKSIVLSDAFLDMPMSARCLYFTLSMVADDDGFVGAPKAIMRQCGASIDDMRVLLGKRYVLEFESGVIVIKHWRINNYLRNDRHMPTTYREELATLGIDEKGAYVEKEMTQECIVETADYKKPDWKVEREEAYKNSSLPCSFDNKIKGLFDGVECPICGRTMVNSESSMTRPTIKHNIPISDGGGHELGNISVVCSKCILDIRNISVDDINSKDVEEKWRIACGFGEKKSEQKKREKHDYSEDFDLFWRNYPVKKGKMTAQKSFNKVISSGKADIQTILSAIDSQKKSRQWRENNGRYIPHPTTWLNQARWLDEDTHPVDSYDYAGSDDGI